MKSPIAAIKLLAVSSTIPNDPPSNPNVDKNQITIQATTKIVPALIKNPFNLSHTCNNTVFALGIWYSGNSITNGAGLPEKGFVFFNIIAATNTATIPTKYIAGAINPAACQPATLPAITPPNKAITGNLAPQGINVAVIIVKRRSLSCSIVFDAIIAGIPQPEPINNGIKLFPDKPKYLNTLSITKAIRTMYPQSSKIDKNKNRIAIWGANPITAPTPPIIPSTITAVNKLLAPTEPKNPDTASWIATTKTSFVQSVTNVPIVVTEI